MLARQVAVDELGRLVVTRAALPNLVDGGHGGSKVVRLANFVRCAMAVDAARLVLMHAAADRPQNRAVTLSAAVLVGQRLQAALVTLVDDVRVALPARNVGVGR